MTTLGVYLRAHRLQYVKVSKAAGLGQSTVSAYLTGRLRLGRKRRRKLFGYLQARRIARHAV